MFTCRFFFIIYNQTTMSIIQTSQKALEYDKILAELANFAKTDQSKELCLNLTPYTQYEDIEREIRYTREAKDVLDLARDIPIEKIQNFSKLKTKNEYFTEEELIDIAKTMRTSRIVKNFLKENLVFDAAMSGLLENLYSFIQYELESPYRFIEEFEKQYHKSLSLVSYHGHVRHVFTHRTWSMHIYHFTLSEPLKTLYDLEAISQLPVSTAHLKVLKQYLKQP